ncbi:hypothetical protein HBI56_022020 [Parastagonospora nodorum]|uniref:Uncharacterized protein n=1 Tax=Phaeosphaeria nodorum (strain SN15 / ATCC MYA-4574 / FGSC 10173) TaxID=321614 RepID=A0A7U2F0U9_PHANO|nr:hypothetical protein HBH56_175010 [Parastagonospora nodorum]QRC96307.1 hypothetical protein JI435_300850 [Parastagonospora nodorum SN15]KAH3926310.1 hypothetical protein HBH54_168160 [Parastagonospora nodorum]KAH3955818.1 hypothetical protein HBH53_000980 [Parastagonospora nodorum]KAH3965696.1 hypothetical protein HBH52_204820 [Parastagonospora nodorum]
MENSKLPSSRIHKESAFQFWTPGYRLHEPKQRESRASTTQILSQEPFGHARICQITFWPAAITKSHVIRPLLVRFACHPSASRTNFLANSPWTSSWCPTRTHYSLRLPRDTSGQHAPETLGISTAATALANKKLRCDAPRSQSFMKPFRLAAISSFRGR